MVMKRFLTFLVAVLIGSTVFASADATDDGKKEKFNVGKMIMHHIGSMSNASKVSRTFLLIRSASW